MVSEAFLSAAATVARKLASVRGRYDHLVRIEAVGQNPNTPRARTS